MRFTPEISACAFPPIPAHDLIEVQENIKYYVQDYITDARQKFVLLPDFAKFVIAANFLGWILWKIAPQWMKKHASNLSYNIKFGRIHTLLLSSFSSVHFMPMVSNMLFFQNLIQPLTYDLGEPFNILLIVASAVGSNLLQAILHKFTGTNVNYFATEGFAGVNVALLYWFSLMRPGSEFNFDVPRIFPHQKPLSVAVSPKNLLLWSTLSDLGRFAVDLIFGGTITTSNRLCGLVIGVGMKILACKCDWMRGLIRWNKRSLLCRPVLAKELF